MTLTVLLTGSEGVLGKRIKELLPKMIDARIIGLDIKETADIVGDIRNYDVLVSAMKTYRPDVVLHFAALTSPIESTYREIEYYDVNMIGTAKLVKIVPRDALFIFASSCAVYGNAYDVLKRPVILSDAWRFTPLSPYGLSKLFAEKIIRSHRDDAVILRFGNVYSPYDDKYVFWKMFSNKVFVLNDPDAVRDFVSVDDLIRLIVKIIRRWDAGEYVGGTYNVGGEPLKMADVVEIARKKAGWPEKVVIGNGLKPGEFKRMVLNITATRDAFDWSPIDRLENYIDVLDRYFRMRSAGR